MSAIMTDKAVIMDKIASDHSILESLGAGLRRQRLSLDLTQTMVAGEAGVTRDTVRRMESGESVSTVNLVRVLRALGMTDALTGLIPDRGPGPLEQLQRGPEGRKRAGGRAKPEVPASEWRWEDEGDS